MKVFTFRFCYSILLTYLFISMPTEMPDQIIFASAHILHFSTLRILDLRSECCGQLEKALSFAGCSSRQPPCHQIVVEQMPVPPDALTERGLPLTTLVWMSRIRKTPCHEQRLSGRSITSHETHSAAHPTVPLQPCPRCHEHTHAHITNERSVITRATLPWCSSFMVDDSTTAP